MKASTVAQKKKKKKDDEIAQVGVLGSSAIVEEVDYEEELKEIRRKQALASSKVPLDARQDIANKTKKRKSSVANDTVEIDREEENDLDLLSLAPMINDEAPRFITAKEFKDIKIDEDKSTALDKKIPLGKGQLAFAQDQDINIKAPKKGYVKETIVGGKFTYEIVLGSEDSPTKIYKIQVPRLVDGKHSTTDFDTMYFNAKNEIVGLDEATAGKSQLDPTWLKEKKTEYDLAMEEEALISAASVSVDEDIVVPIKSKASKLRSTLSEDRRELDDIEDSEFEDATDDRANTSLATTAEIKQIQERVNTLEASHTRGAAIKELREFNENNAAEFDQDIAKKLSVVLSDPEAIDTTDMKVVKQAIERAEGKDNTLDDFHLVSIAAKNGHLAAIESLLDQDADANHLDPKGNRPLDYTKDNEDVANILGAHGAKTSIEIRYEVNKVVEAIKVKDVEKVKELVRNITHIDALDSDGKTILDHANEMKAAEPPVEDRSVFHPTTWVRGTPKIDQILAVLKEKQAKTAQQMAQGEAGKTVIPMIIAAPNAPHKTQSKGMQSEL